MSETLSTQETPKEEQIDLGALHKKQDEILAGERDISELSESELRTLEAEAYPNREEIVNKAHELGIAIDRQETGMARSRKRINDANEAIHTLENSKDSATWLNKLKINRQIGDLEDDVHDVDNVDYWEDITKQRDDKAEKAAAAYDARVEVKAALNQEK